MTHPPAAQREAAGRAGGGARNGAFDRDDLRRLRDRADARTLAAAFVPGMKRDGPDKMKGRCPFHAEKTPSFYAWRDHYHCFGCGAHGDAIGFLMQSERLGFPEAAQQLAARLGLTLASVPAVRAHRPQPAAVQAALPPDPADLEREAEDMRRLLAVWREARPLTPKDPVWLYLQGRGLDVALLAPWLGSLRFEPAMPYWHERQHLASPPAMVALIQGHDGKPIGLHLTYLQAAASAAAGASRAQERAAGGCRPAVIEKLRLEHVDADGVVEALPAKKVRGRHAGGAIRFGPPAPWILGGEGIETALSELERRLAVGEPGCGEAWSVWSLVSLGNFAGKGERESKPRLHPDPAKRDQQGRRRTLPSPIPGEGAAFKAPAGTRRFTWIADSDAKDPAAAEMLLARGTARMTAAGIACGVIRAAAGMDRNDELKAIKGAAHPRDPAASRASGPAGGCSGGDAAPVSGSLQ